MKETGEVPPRPRASYVIGPAGNLLSLANLPPPAPKRWNVRRKAEVVAAVIGGLISLDEACHHYTLTIQEFLVWQHAMDRFGPAGLRGVQNPHHRANPERDERRLQEISSGGDERLYLQACRYGQTVTNDCPSSQDAQPGGNFAAAIG